MSERPGKMQSGKEMEVASFVLVEFGVDGMTERKEGRGGEDIVGEKEETNPVMITFRNAESTQSKKKLK